MFILVFLYFLRMGFHYLMQYFFCKILQIPVTKFRPHWHRIDLEYASWTFAQEAGIVSTGILANTAVFLLLDGFAYLVRTKCNCFPKMWYKVIAYYGVFAILDPVIVLFFDIVTANWENGDFFKFYHYFVSRDEHGAVGIYICIFMTFMLTVGTAYAFYRYMVFRFMNGRILDLYRRLSGQYKEFFIPLDQEVSIKYLQWVITRAKKKNCCITFTKQVAKDKYGLDKEVSFLKIYKIEKSCFKFNRMFFKDFDGALREVPQKRVWLTDIELNKLLKAQRHDEAAVYGDGVVEIMEQNGLRDDKDGYTKVIETLAINTREIRNVESALGDAETQQKLVAATVVE